MPATATRNASAKSALHPRALASEELVLALELSNTLAAMLVDVEAHAATVQPRGSPQSRANLSAAPRERA